MPPRMKYNLSKLINRPITSTKVETENNLESNTAFLPRAPAVPKCLQCPKARHCPDPFVSMTSSVLTTTMLGGMLLSLF